MFWILQSLVKRSRGEVWRKKAHFIHKQEMTKRSLDGEWNPAWKGVRAIELEERRQTHQSIIDAGKPAWQNTPRGEQWPLGGHISEFWRVRCGCPRLGMASCTSTIHKVGLCSGEEGTCPILIPSVLLMKSPSCPERWGRMRDNPKTNWAFTEVRLTFKQQWMHCLESVRLRFLPLRGMGVWDLN